MISWVLASIDFWADDLSAQTTSQSEGEGISLNIQESLALRRFAGAIEQIVQFQFVDLVATGSMSWSAPERFECVEMLVAQIPVQLLGNGDGSTVLRDLDIQVVQIAHVGGRLNPGCRSIGGQQYYSFIYISSIFQISNFRFSVFSSICFARGYIHRRLVLWFLTFAVAVCLILVRLVFGLLVWLLYFHLYYNGYFLAGWAEEKWGIRETINRTRSQGKGIEGQADFRFNVWRRASKWETVGAGRWWNGSTMKAGGDRDW